MMRLCAIGDRRGGKNMEQSTAGTGSDVIRDDYPYVAMAPNTPWTILGKGDFIEGLILSFNV